ncbi:MAG: moaE [Friedmanniella sp.]|nr:moaE [Friedmanniella sp.]
MTSVVRAAGVTDAPLSVDRLLALVSGPEVGGIALFVGVVRRHDPVSEQPGDDVVSLDYTGHPTAAVVLRRCAEDVAARHEVLAVAVEHRVGHLEVGDLAVVVAAGAVHRGAALAACAELIETLKAEVPIWKEQAFLGGDTEWVGLGTAESTGTTEAHPGEPGS